MSAFRIEPIDREPVRQQRRPRLTDTRHLAFIRLCPCVVTGGRPVDPAHLRVGNRLLGKRAVGVGEKPDDRWTIPLCRRAHDEQHRIGDELAFWRKHGIANPFQLSLALFAASCADDLALAELICSEHRMLRSN